MTERYEALEKEHLGDPNLGTGIYHPDNLKKARLDFSDKSVAAVNRSIQQQEEAKRPLVGVGVAIFWGHQVLLHKRTGGHAPGVWAFPGGHLEFGETFAECAMRETREECGTDLRVKVPRFWTAVNTVYPDEGKHYVVIFMYTHHIGGLPRNMEPTKGGEWRWFHVDALPSPLMMGIDVLTQMGLLRPNSIDRLVP